MPEVSQGSSLLATLRFTAESLWDSRSLASIKIRVRRSVPGRSNVEMSSRPGNIEALARSVVAAPGDGGTPPPKTDPLPTKRFCHCQARVHLIKMQSPGAGKTVDYDG